MKTKTISKELSRLHGKWMKSITDKKVRALVEKDTIITGGAIASMLLTEDVNDYDVYFATAEAVAEVAEYYLKIMKKLDPSTETVRMRYYDDKDVQCTKKEFFKEKEGRAKIYIPSTGYVKLKKSKMFESIFVSGNAKKLTGKIQIVLRFWGNPPAIHKNYDFVHCMSYWTKKGLVIPEDSALALLTKELKYQGSRYPLTSIIRTRKFIRKGWKITAGEYLKMAAQLQKIDLFDPNVLEDQLMGVDISYFTAFINKMKAFVATGGEITTDYVIDLVDEIFDGEHDLIDGEEEDE